ncbi:hypothetical protein LV716_04175 [Flagellimonas sp. HMM57]|uniref:hypothetical protein n=1 Tax=unclassified Flagellimonas TaxID=2644544 RepID=UPI0013CFA34C|nr:MULTISPECIES: hypothetical protein [unclassified Flagellimonas]UII76994.1 hypothetical protein LV716_04175 [Flagellimonas sp. HMM57]
MKVDALDRTRVRLIILVSRLRGVLKVLTWYLSNTLSIMVAEVSVGSVELGKVNKFLLEKTEKLIFYILEQEKKNYGFITLNNLMRTSYEK